VGADPLRPPAVQRVPVAVCAHALGGTHGRGTAAAGRVQVDMEDLRASTDTEGLVFCTATRCCGNKVVVLMAGCLYRMPAAVRM
jgi:hypothetical protein